MSRDQSSDEPSAEDGPLSWDQQKADSLIGKYAPVGITRLAPDGKTVKSQTQYHGRIIAADRANGFKIECEGALAGKIMGLPPDLRPFKPAASGEYKLRSTGEIVNDPDVLASWSIVEPSKH